MDALAELLTVMVPPTRPLFADGNWEAVEEAIGLRLPADYKAYIRAYGSGMVGGGFDIPSPLRPGEDIRPWWSRLANLYKSIAEYVPVPYPVFPESGGLLPFGTFGDVNILNWLTVGDPDHWPFVYYDQVHGFFQIKGLSCVEFILEAVTQRSPLLIRLGYLSDFNPPQDFIGHAATPRRRDLIHPRTVELRRLVERLASRWPADEVRVRKAPNRVFLLIEPLSGSIHLDQDGGIEDTICRIFYDQSCASQVDEVVAELLTEGFTECSSM